MRKNKGLALAGLIACCVLLFCTGVGAEPGRFSVSGGYGKSADSIDIFRFGVQKPFFTRWFESSTGSLSGYFELSYNVWDKSGDTTNGVAFSPVFVYCFNLTDFQHIIPYVEAGIGAAYIDDYHIAGRNLSSHFQFEDRIGIGVQVYRMDFKFGYMHYSNAGLKSPNDGIDIFIGTVAWWF
jgi:lipid A 3-O-deacylase